MERKEGITVEKLLDKIWMLERQVDWLCGEIPHIGDLKEPDDGKVESTLDMDERRCPNWELYKTCDNLRNPDEEQMNMICSKCWKRESWKAISQENL